MPEQESVNHLGHRSRAVHAAYADGAQVAVMPSSSTKHNGTKKVIKFEQGAQLSMTDPDEQKRKVQQAKQKSAR